MKTEIKEYSATEAALSGLEEKYTEIPDCSTTEGYDETRAGIAELRGYRTSLDKVRKSLGEEARTHLNMVNSEAKRITSRLVALEDPMKEAKKAVDDEAERIKAEELSKEQKRMDGIELKIKEIREAVYCNRTVLAISEAIDSIEAVDPESGFDEFSESAQHFKDESLKQLNEYLVTAKQQDEEASRVAKVAEEQEAQRKEMEAEQAELDKQKAKQQAVTDAQNLEIEKQKAVEEERARVKTEKERVEQEAKEQAELEAQKTKEAEAKILVDRGKYANDEAELVAYANSILDVELKALELKLETDDAREIAASASSMLFEAASLITQSAVVKSQRTEEPE